MKLVPSNHPALKTISETVLEVEIKDICAKYNELRKIMVKNGGCGLAANQLGIAKQFFVWQYGICINPKIISQSDETSSDYEGCLSFPGKKVLVTRPKTIQVEYIDERGIKMEKTLTGMPARIFQHEHDHLFGKTIV